MDARIIILLLLFLCGTDAFFGVALYLHWDKYELFGKDLVPYSFAHSTFEFWILCIIRVVLLLGCAIGISVNLRGSVKVFTMFRYNIGVASIIVVLYTISKIMVYTEFLDGNHDNDAWFLSLRTWTMVASLGMYVMWIKILPEVQWNDEDLPDDPDKLKLIDEGDSDSGVGDDDSGGVCDVEKRLNKKESVKWYSRLVYYSKQDWPALVAGIVALVISAVGKTFIPLLAGRVIDGVVLNKDTSAFHECILLMTLSTCVVAVSKGARKACLTIAVASLNQRITNHLFESILKQDIGFFDKNRTGEITSRLASDTTTMSDALNVTIKIFLHNIFQVISYTTVMVVLSWRLSIITLISLVLLGIITDIVGNYFEDIYRKVQGALASANIVAEETISSMKTVRSFANEDGERSTYADRLEVAYQLRKSGAIAIGVSKGMVTVFEMMVFVVTLFYGGHLIINEEVSGGMLVSYILYQLKVGGSLEDIAEGYAELMKAAGASRRVFELIDLSPAFERDGQVTIKNFKGYLEFRNVSFAYPSSPDTPILKDVTFEAHPGEVLALVGPSGGGKTSCINLIENFYQPSSGEVLIDGINVKDFDHSYLHTKVALVGQEPVLYARTIQENISYSLTRCSREQVYNAAKEANAHHFILGLPRGYDTDTGEKGIRLSGGQKQRVAIARALVRNPQMLLLDEATSALDAESEHIVQEALARNFGNRTVVIVAHRLSTIEKADRIVVIDHGTVVEQGCHQELISNNGLYAGLVRRQLVGHSKDENIDRAIDNIEE